LKVEGSNDFVVGVAGKNIIKGHVLTSSMYSRKKGYIFIIYILINYIFLHINLSFLVLQ
jgi:hypothetical protein